MSGRPCVQGLEPGSREILGKSGRLGSSPARSRRESGGANCAFGVVVNLLWWWGWP